MNSIYIMPWVEWLYDKVGIYTLVSWAIFFDILWCKSGKTSPVIVMVGSRCIRRRETIRIKCIDIEITKWVAVVLWCFRRLRRQRCNQQWKNWNEHRSLTHGSSYGPSPHCGNCSGKPISICALHDDGVCNACFVYRYFGLSPLNAAFLPQRCSRGVPKPDNTCKHPTRPETYR